LKRFSKTLYYYFQYTFNVARRQENIHLGVKFMKKFSILNKIRENYLIAVVRGKGFDDTVKMIDSIIEGGIRNIEITYTTPQASELIGHFAGRDDICVGAGTVMSAGTADEAIRRGAQYVVTPHFDAE